MLDCSPDSTRELRTCRSAPSTTGAVRATTAGSDGVGLATGLGHRLLEDQLEQLGGVDRVVRRRRRPSGGPSTLCSIVPTRACWSALERRAAVGERHLVDDRLGATLVDDEQRLDADLARGVVEPPRPQLAQHRAAGPSRHTSAGAPSTARRARAWSG